MILSPSVSLRMEGRGSSERKNQRIEGSAHLFLVDQYSRVSVEHWDFELNLQPLAGKSQNLQTGPAITGGMLWGWVALA